MGKSTHLIRGLGLQKIIWNYLYKGNSARIYRLFKFYRTAIKKNQHRDCQNKLYAEI